MVNLPTKQECIHLLRVTYRLPQNIIEHSIQVNRLSVFLATKLNDKGFNVNIDLIDRASILHDILKIIEIDNLFDFIDPESNQNVLLSKKDRMVWINLKKRYGHLTHEEAGYQIFKEKYPEMALVIKKHGYTNLKGENELKTWEEKLVHYADKRVKHRIIVSMFERLQEGHKRYEKKNLLKGINFEFQKKTDKKLIDLEKEIFNNLDFKPDDIPGIMDQN
jgi:uncharacterized protein